MILNKNMSVFHKDFTEFNQEKDFDLIYSFNVFEHLSDQNKYIAIINKLLSLKGKSVIFAQIMIFLMNPIL